VGSDLAGVNLRRGYRDCHPSLETRD
jgi:hypothetical protein